MCHRHRCDTVAQYQGVMEMRFLFIDFEVFVEDWLCVIIDPIDDDMQIIINNAERLKKFYEANRDALWIGYNILRYDQYIFKGAMLGMNVKRINDMIIREEIAGYRISSAFQDIPMNIYDLMEKDDKSLKLYEGMMGINIKESDVSFNIGRKLTYKELYEVVKYCIHDVKSTIKVFEAKEKLDDFEARVTLLKAMKLPVSDLAKTKAQLAAKILHARRREYYDEFNILIPTNIRIKRYGKVVDWFTSLENRDYDKNLEIMVADVPHVFAWGGVHGARRNYVKSGYFINMDVASLYPAIMLEYGLLSRSCEGDRFRDIVNLRLKLKKEGNPMQKSLKIVINGTYGASKDRMSKLYDPRQANNVCIHGQLLLLDLLERMEEVGAEIVQTNTDGILIRMPNWYEGGKEQFRKDVEATAKEWEQRTHLVLEFDEFIKVVQGDVNNYLAVPTGDLFKPNGEYRGKIKGAYLKKLNTLEYDLAIVNKALFKYCLDGTPVRQTIMKGDRLKDFQMVKKISNKYTGLYYGGKPLNERCIRMFATKEMSGMTITKRSKETGKLAKLEGSPTKAVIINEDVNGLSIPDWLDREWYIRLAERRMVKFLNPKEGAMF